MKKVLIITYYWPPKGGVGVQRWLKLTKYLCQQNYQPIIYTSANGLSPLEDYNLKSSIPKGLKVLKKRIFEPQKILSFFTRKKPSSDVLIIPKPSVFKKIILWIRANFFVPDSRCFWIRPSVNFLTEYIKKNKIDIIISSGPPHSMHMIALKLKLKYNHIKWIADFRDPWTDIEYFEKLPMLSFVRNKHKKLEKKVLTSSDLVLSVSSSWSNDLMRQGAKKVFVLTNGYDSEDYHYNVQKSNANLFQVGHFGLYNKFRDHTFFWDVMRKISHNSPSFHSDLKLFFTGEVHSSFMNNIKDYNFHRNMEYHAYLSHQDAIKNMMQCDMLLVTQSKEKAVMGRLPAKLFEYFAAKKPILAIGQKNSDLEKIVSNISYAWFVDFDNSELLYDTILKIYNLRKSAMNYNDDISNFSRLNQAKELVKLFNTI